MDGDVFDLHFGRSVSSRLRVKRGVGYILWSNVTNGVQVRLRWG